MAGLRMGGALGGCRGCRHDGLTLCRRHRFVLRDDMGTWMVVRAPMKGGFRGEEYPRSITKMGFCGF